MAHYDDVIMPRSVRFGSSSGPTTSTQVVVTGGGHRKANRRWDQHLRRFALTYLREPEDIHAILEIFEGVDGPANSFLARDWNDWNTTAGRMKPGDEAQITAFDQPLRNTADNSFLADGATRTFQMVKRYLPGSAGHTRVIEKPQAGTIRAAVDGVELLEGSPTDFTVNTATGIVTFQTAPGATGSPTAVPVTWGGAFHVPVAFVNDEFIQGLQSAETTELPDIPLIEVRL